MTALTGSLVDTLIRGGAQSVNESTNQQARPSLSTRRKRLRCATDDLFHGHFLTPRQ